MDSIPLNDGDPVILVTDAPNIVFYNNKLYRRRKKNKNSSRPSLLRRRRRAVRDLILRDARNSFRPEARIQLKPWKKKGCGWST